MVTPPTSRVLAQQVPELETAIRHQALLTIRGCCVVTIAYGVARKPDQAGQILEQILPHAETVSYRIALIYAGMRNEAKALDWLNKAIVARNDDVTQIKVDQGLTHCDPTGVFSSS
jgi:hypothetical protein